MRLSVLLLAGAVALLAAISVPLVSATHFAFGTVSWNLVTGTTKTFTYVVEQAYRRTFFDPLPAAGPPPNGPFNVGGFYLRNPSGSTEQSANINLVPKQIYATDDYWTGTWSVTWTPNLATGRYSHYFDMCCRISTIADANHDQSATLISYQDITQSASPRTTALPRFYFQVNQPAAFTVPGTSPQQYPLTFAVPAGSESSLVVLNPGGAPALSLNTATGVCTWTPNVVGLFAWQVRVSDGKSQVPLDILFQVLKQCVPASQCPQPPYFIPATPQDQTFYRGVQRSFTLQATNIDASSTTTIQNSVLPNGGSFTRLSSVGPLCTYQLTWQPSLSDSSWTMCFAAQSSNGLNSLGNYCLQLNIGTAALIYVSGIVRDFSKGSVAGSSTPYLFNNPIDNQDDGTANQFVSTTLAPTGKPVFSGSTRGSGLSAAIFNQWWQTDAAGVINKEVVLSTTLSNGTNSDARVFTFLSSSYYPIDNLGFGNEGDTHNRFFTYEIHTYLTYNGGEIFNLQSSDDLWVFVNNKLPTSWPMNGIHPFTSQSFALNMDAQATNFGITAGNTYRLDIFYACRSQQHDCGFKLELPAAILCDAIQSGTTAINVTGAFSAASITTLGQAAVTSGNIRIIPATASSDSGSAWYPGTDGPGPQRQKLLHGFSTEFDFKTSGCVTSSPPEGFAFVVQAASVGARGGEAGNLGYATIANSLAVEFDMNYNSEFGDPVDNCVGGTGLGYQHVSFHTGRTLPNSASETYSIGSSLCPGTSKLTLTMHNSTWHRVKITFTPAKDDPSGGPQLGWVRVFMSIVNDAGVVQTTVIAPIAEAQVDGLVLQQMWAGGAAYAGFTASSQDTNRCNIDIRRWSMVVVPPSASLTTTTSTLATIRAGTTGVASVQAKDSCGNLIKTGGDLSLFDSTFRPRLGYSSVSTIYPTIADLATGIYTFSYTPTKTGIMSLVVTMDGSPILNSPFQVIVNAGPTVAASSVFVYSPDIAMTESNSLLQSALFLVAAEPSYGDIKFKKSYTMTSATAAATLQADIAALTNGYVVAVAFAGTLGTTWTSTSVTQQALGLVGASQAYQVANGGSYCSVGVKAAAAFVSTTQTRFDDQPTAILKVPYTGSGQSFKVWCQSAGANWGNYGQVLVVPDVVHVPAGASTNIYIEARDAYNNLNTDGGDNFALSFQPDINQLGGSNVVNALTAAYDGHYVVNFVCTLAGKLAMYVKLDGTQIGASGTAVDVFIDADIAVASRSTASGTGLVQATAGSVATFTLQLYDQYGNQVTSYNRKDVILSPTITSTSTPANTYTATCSWVGSSSPQVYTCTYTPLKTGTDYKLSVSINGAIMPSAISITVVAGLPVASRATAIGAGITTSSTVVAGTEVSWWIQSYDINDNMVLVASPVGTGYVYTVAYGTGTGAVSTITGLTPVHDGLGKYLSKYVPTTRSSTGTITITASMGGTTIGRPTQPMTITVVPGAVAAKSILSKVTYYMVAGQTFTAQVESRDAYDNPRNVGPFTDGTAFAVRFKTTGSVDVRGTTAFLTATNQNYPLTYTTTVSGQYQLDVKVAATSTDIVYPGSDAPLVMVYPGPTVSSKCTVYGPGTLSGVQATSATFTIQAADQYSNPQNNTNDRFIITGATGSAVPAENGGLTPGQFLFTYTVPSLGSYPGTFTLVVQRQVPPAYTAVETVATFTVSVFQNPQVSYARLQPTSGQTTLIAQAGVPLAFTIKNRNQANTDPDLAAGEAGWFFTMAVTKVGSPTTSLTTVPANTITITPGAATSTALTTTWSGTLTAGAGTVGSWNPVLYLKGSFPVALTQPTIIITAGPATSASAIVTGLPFLTAVAGNNYTFTVQLRDQFNNLVTTGTDSVTYLLSGTTYSCRWSAVSSTYNCSYYVTRPIGSLQVQVLLNTVNVIGTYSLVVAPAAPDAASTTATGVGLASASVGNAVTFKVTVLDRFGNLALVDTITGGVAVPSPTVTLTMAVTNGATPVTITPAAGTLRYLSSSVYEFEYLTTAASALGSSFSLAVNLGGTSIKASPFSLNVLPGAVYGPTTTLSGTTTQVVAGQPIVFTVIARDQYGNLVRSQEGAITAAATAPSTTTATSTEAVITLAGPAGNFTVTFPGTSTQKMGAYPFTFTAAGSAFVPSGSGTTTSSVTVIAGPTDPDQTIVPLSMPAGYAGQDASIQITLADKYQNKRTPATSELIVVNFDDGKADCVYETELSVRVDAGIHKTRFPSVTSRFPTRSVSYAAATGIYTITYNTQVVGAYSMNLTINGVVMGCAKQSQVTFNVAPGPVSNSMSYYSAPQPGIAGIGQEITIQLRDQYGNNLNRDRTGDSTNGVKLELGVQASAAYPTETTDHPWFGKGKSIVIGTNELYSAQFSTAWTSDGPNLTYVGGDTPGLYRFNINTTVAADFAFLLAVNFGAGGGVISGVQNLTIIPSPPARFLTPTFPTDTRAAVPASFTLQGTDILYNPITTNLHTYSVLFNRVGSPSYKFSGTPVSIGNGRHRVDFRSSWHGEYEVTIVLIVGGKEVLASSQTVRPYTILTATCAGTDATKPYRCPSGLCVAAYTDCTDITTTCSGSTPVLCANGACAASATACACPNSIARCPDGHCPATAGDCLPVNDCGDLVLCSSGVCRATTNDCPTQLVCPPGQGICPSNVACAASLALCDVAVYNSSCPSGQTHCADGSCASDIDDCATGKTCASGQVLCPDGSCQVSAAACPSTYKCYDPAPFRCPNGECRVSSDQCPNLVVCSAGAVLCPSGACASSLDACTSLPTCSLAQVRCPDGSCANNLDFCATTPTCTDAKPVRCSDGSCQVSSFLCPEPRVCPTGYSVCTDGTCVTASQTCPTQPTCPVETPGLCSDGTCVADMTLCTTVPSCPTAAPLRCPDGSCRGSFDDCPSQSACPSTLPVRCPDGSCSVAIGSCLPIVGCSNSTIRCPGGECAASLQLCPTHVTCPVGSAKCLDGTCRSVCPSSGLFACEGTNVTCPQAGFGVQCAASISQCPQAPVCPANKPVKCIDVTCAASVDLCPPLPTSFPDNKVACADWTWQSSIKECGTAVTCPLIAPYKCYDDTCRASPNDCPSPPSCSGDTPYLCPNGVCAQYLWSPNCGSSGTPCDQVATPVKCPNGECKVSTDQCEQAVTISDSTQCPISWSRCRDGSCMPNAQSCADLSCPTILPYLCTDGLCALDKDHCNQPNGCPSTQPIKCAGGVCVSAARLCPNSTVVSCPSARPVACPDGSCGLTVASCANANGCFGTQVLCADKRCVAAPTAEVNRCTDGASVANTCPTTAPYQCPNGFCAQTSLLCPKLVPVTCPSSAPAQCADGSCRAALLQCPVISPCDGETPTRCPDGSCRADADLCPLLSTCPASISYRCPNGLCAASAGGCINDVGCPLAAPYKCTTGVCVAAASDCSALVPVGNGCPTASPVKCWDGACAATSSACRALNGCPAATAFRCKIDGACVARPSLCSTHTACTGITCADGSCVTAVTSCNALNGCPITTPYRCGDGSCAANAGACTPVAVCDLDAGEVQCYDGKCVSSYTQCAPATECVSPSVRCPDLTCVSSLSLCPTVPSCPVTAPVLCPSGVCKGSTASCPSTSGTGAIGSGGVDLTRPTCSGSTPVECFDGSCKATYAACMSLNAAVLGTTYSSTAAVAVCTGQATCANGACAANQWACPVVKACATNFWRCPDGTCVNSTSSNVATCATIASCASGTVRCEDGSCRAQCLQFDGCPLNLPYHCANRECAANKAGCATADIFDTSFALKSRRLLSSSTGTSSSSTRSSSSGSSSSSSSASSVPASICYKNCAADTKALYLEYTVDRTQENKFAIAVDATRSELTTLTISGGSLVKYDNSNTTASIKFYVHPVGASRLRKTVDKVTLSRRGTFGTYMPYSAAVLSPAFECSVDAFIIQPFPVLIQAQSAIDMTRYPLYNDVCLAFTFYIPAVNFAAWKCVDRTDISRAANPVRTAAANRTDAINIVTGKFDKCAVQNGATTGTIYAFVHQPARAPNLGSDAVDTFWADNIIWIVLGFCSFGAIMAGVFYAAKRLHRYRMKYKEETAAVGKMQEEVDNMEQFGGQAGTKDEQLEMMSNPMVVQMQQMQARLDAKNAEVLQEEKEEREKASEARQEHIQNLAADREKLAAELDALKAQLALSSPSARSPVAVTVPIMSSGATASAAARSKPATARTDFDTKPAQRKKKNADDD